MQAEERDVQILRKIVGYCNDIEFAHKEYHRDYAVFCNNPTYRNAIALCLMQIGELTNKLSEDFKNQHTEIPWRSIRGMRNVVAHEYGNIDVETVWETAENGTQELLLFCQRVLG
jgi:uncharacterized protein with HEPN domain